MIYSSWDIEWDRLKLVIMGRFLPFYLRPLKSWKTRILKKWKKLLEISSFYTCVPKTTIISGMVPEIQSKTGRIFCHFGPFFLHFYPLTTHKIKILKQWKNNLKMSSFYTCVPKITIIWCMLPEIWSPTDIIFGHFGPLFALLHH